VLVPYGSLFYAAAPLFDAQLPEVTPDTRHAVVILVLRDKKDVASSFLNVVARYAGALRGQKSKLMLAGVDPDVIAQMERTGVVRDVGRENLFQATQDVGEALMQAVAAAESWIGEKQKENPSQTVDHRPNGEPL
jgi:SulP family sulfate permease